MDWLKILNPKYIDYIDYEKFSGLIFVIGILIIASLLVANFIFFGTFHYTNIPKALETIAAVSFALYIIWGLLVARKLWNIFYIFGGSRNESTIRFNESLTNLIFQGNVRMLDETSLEITNSEPGLLLKEYAETYNRTWLMRLAPLRWRNFEINYSFSFYNQRDNKALHESIEWELDVINGQAVPIYKKNWVNYLGFIFRAQDLDNYYMLSIGINSKFDRTSQIMTNLRITPHIRLDGKWDILARHELEEQLIDLKSSHEIKCCIENNVLKLWIGINGEQIDESSNPIYEWTLPTNFRQGPSDQNQGYGEKKEGLQMYGDSSTIYFRNYFGTLGFRCYSNEYAVVKDIRIKAI